MKLRIPFWMVPFFVFLSGYTFAYFFVQKKIVAVPRLIGKSVSAALVQVKQSHLMLQLLEEKEDATLPDGTIVYQVPQAGRHIHVLQPISVALSKVPAVPQTPSYLGQPYEQVLSEAKKNFIIIKNLILPATSITSGKCFAQSPSPGSPLRKPFVKVFCAKLPAQLFIMPSFVGRSFAEVQSTVPGDHIQLIMLSGQGHEPSSTATVHDQSPAAGSIVDFAKRLVVHLYVA